MSYLWVVMKLILRSFFTTNSSDANTFSVARWQPNGYHFEPLQFMMPYDFNGQSIKHEPPDKYLAKYVSTLQRNLGRIVSWVEGRVTLGADTTLCCWCNPKRQQQYPQLMCHTILIGYVIEEVNRENPGRIEVKYLDGRDNPVWTREQFRDSWRQK